MMQFLQVRTLIAAAALSVATQAHAQQPARPTAEQTRAILQARPELVQQLRQRLVSTGMTRDQIHARLRAEGYPEDLLDAYLPGGTGEAPTTDVYRAVQDLGIADSSDVAFFRLIGNDSTPESVRDSLIRMRDSLYKRDSLSRFGRRVVVRADVADSLIRLDSGYNIFGLEVFRSATSRFEPNVSGPVDANYRLGPGDVLVLILTGDVEASYRLDVTREGFIVVPQVGQLYVANLTLGQLEDVLYSRLGRVYSGVRRGGGTTRFSVSVSRLRTNQVFVLGEAERPGSYMVSSAGTAITALYAAGGPTANGSLRNVQIKRGDKVVATLDLYDYLLHGDATHDARLETGDIVFVPPRGTRVRIIGEVVRPGTYELKANETLADLIAAAGGFHANASRRRIHIERILPPSQRTAEGRDRITIDVQSETGDGDGAASELKLEGGDVIRVFPVAKRVRNTVYVMGAVWGAGPKGFTQGMRVSDAIRLAGGPKPDVYLGQILIDRLRPDSSRIQLRSALRDSLGSVVNDFPLQEDDVVQLFSVADFRPDRYVAIGGAVRKAGRFPYRQGMTMRDLILLAGGLQESAYLKEAEIARLPEDRTGQTTAVTLRVPLDSTYLFERKAGEPYVGAPGLPAPAGGTPEAELRPYDNVLVLQQPNWELQRVVTVAGEVRFPGQYALKNRNEHVADLIDRAGGLTTEAYAEGTVFVRRRGDVGRVAIDVPQALKDRNSPENLLLMDGDQVTVPVRSFVVTVRGAVNAPNVVAYVPGKDMAYYISQAGGPSRNADKGGAFVTQPSGKRETRGRFFSPKPMPGSLVVVPEKDPTAQTNYLSVIGNTAQVLASLVAIIVALRR